MVQFLMWRCRKQDTPPAYCVATGLLRFTSSESTSTTTGVPSVLLAPFSLLTGSGLSLTCHKAAESLLGVDDPLIKQLHMLQKLSVALGCPCIWHDFIGLIQ